MIDLTLLIPISFAGWRNTYIGVPAVITSLVVVSGALMGGPFVGSLLRWRTASPSTLLSSATAGLRQGCRARS